MFDFISKKFKKDNGSEKENQEDLSNRMLKGEFTLQDFADQMGMINKMGSIQKFAKFIPGMPKVTPEQLEKGKIEMTEFKRIISYMTEQERLNPNILNFVSKQRIAKDAGVQVQDIDRLLERFEQSRQFAKMFNKNGKQNRFFK